MDTKNTHKSDKGPFYVRAKEVLMSKGEYKKSKLDDDHLLIKDVRGQVFRLAGVSGEFMRDPKNNKEYPILMLVKENEKGDFDIVGVINETAELIAQNEEEIKNVAEKK